MLKNRLGRQVEDQSRLHPEADLEETFKKDFAKETGIRDESPDKEENGPVAQKLNK